MLVGIGLLIGLPAALAGSRVLSSLLVGVSARDPVTFLTVTLLLTMTGVLAALIPARRAAGVEPRSALVDE